MDQDFSITAVMKQKASRFLKVLWIVILCCSFCCLGYYVNENYIKLNIDPEILVKAEYINSRTIPFPAITICPPNAVNIEFLNISHFFNDLKNRKVQDVEDKKIMTSASHVCYQQMKLMRSLESGVYNDENIVKIFKKVSPKLDKVLMKCGLRKPTECSKIFIQSLTFLGSCFTFNMQGYHTIFNANISADFDVYKRKNITKSWDPIAKAVYHDDDADDIETLQWTTEDGYSTNEDWTQPLRSSGMQYMTVSAKIDPKQLPNVCDNNYKAYRLILHLPNEVPTFSNDNSIFMLGKFKLMRIHASLSKIDDNLRNFLPEQRKCYYKNERKLKYFKSYTKLNCEHECMAEFTLKTCGCVSFSMPRTDGMKVCQFEDIKCYSNIYYQWSKSYYENRENVRKYPDFPCNCWPTCTKIKYFIVNDFHMDSDNLSINSIESGIRVEFGSSQILENTNYVTYNIENFVSDIGGLAGLFLGISLLSLYELMLKVLTIIRNLWIKINAMNGVKTNKQTRKWGNKDTIRYRGRTKKNKVSPEIAIVDMNF